jgi:hypothetical protein
LPSLAALCGFGVMVAAIATFPLPWTQVERLSQSQPAVLEVPAVQRFVDEWTDPGEAILLYGTTVDYRVAERAGVLNVSPWNYWLSLFSEQEVLRALDALEEEKGSKVFLAQGLDPFGLLADRGPVPAVLRARGYEQVVGDPASQLAVFER